MKADYEHDQMVSTIVIRVFPELHAELKALVATRPDRFSTVSRAARAAIIYAMNQPAFIDYGHPDEKNRT